jgi:GTP-binding protein
LRLAADAREARRRRIPTAELNAVLRRAFAKHGPAVVRHKRLKLLYVTQAGIEPPTFVLFVNDPAIVHFSYRRYLERAIRESLDFEGTPIKLVLKSRSESEGPP